MAKTTKPKVDIAGAPVGAGATIETETAEEMLGWLQIRQLETAVTIWLPTRLNEVTNEALPLVSTGVVLPAIAEPLSRKVTVPPPNGRIPETLVVTAAVRV